MCILDGKAYTALQEAGREQYEEDVIGCIIAANNQGKELLTAGRGASHNKEKWVVVSLVRGQAHLPDLSVTGRLLFKFYPVSLPSRALSSQFFRFQANSSFLVTFKS